VGIPAGAGATASSGKSAAATTVTIGPGAGRKSLGGLMVAGIGLAAVGMKEESSPPHLRRACIHLRISFRALSITYIGHSTEYQHRRACDPANLGGHEQFTRDPGSAHVHH
jgi:hypothetical protein